MKLKPIEYLWEDRQRVLGLPITFTRYSLAKDRLFLTTGLLNTTQQELQLYRVRDLTLKQTLGQKIFRVGTIIVHSSDKTNTHLELKNIRQPMEVKELIHDQVEVMRTANNMRTTEYLSDTDECLNCDTPDYG